MKIVFGQQEGVHGMPPGFVPVETRCKHRITSMKLIQECHSMIEHPLLLRFVCPVDEVGGKLHKRMDAGCAARLLDTFHVSCAGRCQIQCAINERFFIPHAALLAAFVLPFPVLLCTAQI